MIESSEIPNVIKQMMGVMGFVWKDFRDGKIKCVSHPNYNAVFNMKNGSFARCGNTIQESPVFSPLGPEIVYVGLSTKCSQGCPWCYKSKTKTGKNLTFKRFEGIVNKLPITVMQIAFGTGDLDANQEMMDILELCRSKGIIPNITISGFGLTNELADKLAKICGAIAISRYKNEDVCYDSAKLLSQFLGKFDYHLQQIHIYQLLCEETYEDCFRTLKSLKTDERLNKVFSLTFLTLKPKGVRNTYHRITDEKKIKKLLNESVKSGLMIGFDTCASSSIKRIDPKNTYLLRGCEASLFSLHCNVDGFIFPCSFLEGEEGYPGINLLEVKDFLKDVWMHEDLRNFRKTLLSKGRKCPKWNLEFK